MFQCQSLSAGAVRLEICHIDLKGTVPFIEGSGGGGNDVHALLRQKFQPLSMAPKHHCLNAAFRVTQREIQVSGTIVIGEIGDLSPHQNALQGTILFQLEPHIAVQLGHA